MDIGTNIQLKREKLKLSQEELATALQVSRQAVSKWETGASLPSFKSVIAMGELFDVSIDELVKGDAKMIAKFQRADDGEEPAWQIGWIIMLLGVVIGGLLAYFHVSHALVFAGSGILALVFFIGMVQQLDWRLVTRILQKRSAFWVTLFWLFFMLLPMFYSFWQRLMHVVATVGNQLR
jgi:transcriptional regulator with XRE-family HTH domain